ncbi:hypothetical protein DAPPUDRAFT_119383 [Daphnia pulex]|uniref:USP domain-containing protein n=1 Tax=Daphnia pulex TaxID=6669 RepID=E9HYD1_DAPPU|nr:hypothetical protein DAPPUDRAFT_119383 [Daphnia pulex]|eukprot:EFX63250.1 hypothetical protein DAPPUDRAFT_119383 [Daphnia pulex]
MRSVSLQARSSSGKRALMNQSSSSHPEIFMSDNKADSPPPSSSSTSANTSGSPSHSLKDNEANLQPSLLSTPSTYVQSCGSLSRRSSSPSHSSSLPSLSFNWLSNKPESHGFFLSLLDSFAVKWNFTESRTLSFPYGNFSQKLNRDISNIADIIPNGDKETSLSVLTVFRGFLAYITLLHDSYAESRQHDEIEFYGRLLIHFQKELPAHMPPVVGKYFYSTICRTYICTTCNESSDNFFEDSLWIICIGKTTHSWACCFQNYCKEQVIQRSCTSCSGESAIERITIHHLPPFPSSTDISLGYPGDGLTDELDVQCYVPWTSSDNPNVATYDIKMRYP